MTTREFEDELLAIRESAVRASESIDRALASRATHEVEAPARAESARRAASWEWKSWTPAQRHAVGRLFGQF
jgi:hypothetical protein